MRIIYIHQYFNTPDMSGGTRSYEMAKRLVAKGHEVHMITSWREGEQREVSDWSRTIEAGINVHWLFLPYSNHMGYRQRIAAFFRFALKSARKAASIPGDIVFATSTPLTVCLPGVYAAKKKRIPMVFEVRDLWPEIPVAMGVLRNSIAIKFARGLERFAYNHASHIVALSPGMKDGVARTGYPNSQISVIPNSSDLDLFDPEKSDPDSFRSRHSELGASPLVVYTGTIGNVNGVDYLVEIAAASKNANFDIQFVVVGYGGCKEKVREYAQSLNVLGKNFHLYPPVSKNDIPSVLRAADLALSLVTNIKALWANSANKVFDSLASGTPIAINYGGWQAELIEKTGTGLILPPSDATIAASKIHDFLVEEDRRTQAGKAARRLAEEHFSRDKLAVELETVLVEAVERS